MKKCIASLVLFLAAFNVGLASIVQPVSWGAKVVKLEDGNAQIRLTGTIQENWHIYDISDYGPDGPNPTELEVHGVRLVGSPYIESAVEREYDSVLVWKLAPAAGKWYCAKTWNFPGATLP